MATFCGVLDSSNRVIRLGTVCESGWTLAAGETFRDDIPADALIYAGSSAVRAMRNPTGQHTRWNATTEAWETADD